MFLLTIACVRHSFVVALQEGQKLSDAAFAGDYATMTDLIVNAKINVNTKDRVRDTIIHH
jgi:hypothetical protein